MIDLRNHKDWDKTNGLLSVSMNPQINDLDSRLHVLLNGSTGNFCLDYTNDDFNMNLALQRAWSSDTGYYVKILPNDDIKIIRWWDGHNETLPYRKVQDNPQRFYQAISNYNPRAVDSVVSFAKEAFIKLRNCIQQEDNGKASLRTFMYLLAALEQEVSTPKEVDATHWHLKKFEENWITKSDWEWIYSAFQKGSNNIAPLVKLVLRHASNKLFQEAHREATRKDFQTVMFGGVDRIYDSGISEGAFYTPTALVRTIVQESLWALDKVKALNERPSIRILDPACGSSEFLREALRQLKIRNYKGKINITSWDISEIACEMSNFVLYYENNTEWNGEVDIVISMRDSLDTDWNKDGKFDIVLMNPPFKSFRNLGERSSKLIKELNGLIKGQPDLASVFWKKAAEITAESGVLGIVMPHSLIIAETYKNLRDYIVKDTGMNFSLIGRLGSAGLFEKAMIIPAVLVGTKNANTNANTVLWTDHQQSSVYTALRKLRIYRSVNIPTPDTTNDYSIYDDKFLTKKDKWSVRSYKIHLLSEKLEGLNKVGDFFNVTRGVDTGNNAAFILTKDEWERLPKGERSYFFPCIMRDSIKRGQLNDSLYLFFPYEKNIISTEEELEKKLPRYFKDKLFDQKEKLKGRFGFENEWWELSRPRYFHNKPKLVSSHFGRSGYFAFDQKGDYKVCQSFAWFPKKTNLDSEAYYFAYLALLHAPLIDKLLEMVCNVLDGGYFDLSKHSIEKMPLPDLTKADQGILSSLTKIGMEIHSGKEVNKDTLNQVVANAYGLNLDNFELE
jgi:hypothetical protein